MAVRKKREIKLHPLWAELADVIGIDAVIRLASAIGGTERYIPARLKANHWLIEIIGRENAERLCGHFAVGIRGGNLTFPSLPRVIAVHVLTAAGFSTREIATKLLLTERTVQRNRAKTTFPAAQHLTLDPFGATSRFIFQQLGLTAEDVQRYGA